MNTDQMLDKLYKNPSELEKMAQERLAVQKALATLDKVANEAALDLSQMGEDEKIQLYNYLVSELQAQEAQPAAPQAPAQPQMPAQTPQVAPQEPQVTEEFQQKVAENMYFSELFGKNAARTYWAELQALQKAAEESEVSETSEGSPTFEAMAKERALQMKQEGEKTAAFDALLTKRAQELLASGKV